MNNIFSARLTRLKNAIGDSLANLRFTAKLRLYMILLVLGLSLLFLFFFAYQTHDIGIQGLRKRGAKMIQDLARDSELGVLSGDLRFLQGPFDALYNMKDVEYVMIYDHKGDLLKGKSKLPAGTLELNKALSRLPVKELKIEAEILNDVRVYEFIKPITSLEVEEIEEELLFEAENPSPQPEAPHKPSPSENLIEEQGKKHIIGYARIGLSSKEVEGDINKIIKIGVFVTGLFLILSVLIAYFLTKMLTRPITTLTQGVKAIIDGDLTQHIQLRSHDELAELAEAFNAMTQRLKNRIDEIKRKNKKLRKAHDKLELRVEKRTAELKILHEQLLHAEKLSALGKMAASLAHEFNNPIYGIKMVLEQLVETNKLSETESNSVNLAIRETNRISHMILNLQDFYRPSSGISTMVDIHQTVEEVLQICQNQLKLNRIEVIKDFAASLPNILVVADQIKQVFLNIITNAIEAMPTSGGQLLILTKSVKNELLIAFKDNGYGISKKNLGKIFDPFFTTKGTVKGSGLGLSVSYGIVKMHGGDILVESIPNQGSTFTIKLPLKKFNISNTNRP